MAVSKEKNTGSGKQNTKSTAAKTSGTGAKRGRPPGSKNKNTAPKISPEEQAKIDRIMKREQRVQHLILAVILIAASAFLMIAMFTELAGAVGRGISYTVFGLFGVVGCLLPFYFAVYALLLIINKGSKKGKLGTVLFLTGFFILIAAAYSIGKLGDISTVKFGWTWLKECFIDGVGKKGGGFIGMLMAFVLVKVIGKGGAYIITAACMVISALITMNKPFSFIMDSINDFRDDREEQRRERLKEEIEEALYSEPDENSISEYPLDMDEYLENSHIAAEEKKKKNSGKKKSIINYLKADEKSMFSRKDDMDDVKAEEIPDMKGKDGEKSGGSSGEEIPKAGEEAAPVPEQAESGETVSYGLGGADSIYAGAMRNKDRTSVRNLDEINSLSFRSPFEETAPEDDENFRIMAAFNDDIKDSSASKHVSSDRTSGEEGVSDSAGLPAVPISGDKITSGAQGTSGRTGVPGKAVSEGGASAAGASGAATVGAAAAGAGVAAGAASAGTVKNSILKKEMMDKNELEKGIEEIKSEMAVKRPDMSSETGEELEYKFPPIDLLKGNSSSGGINENLELTQKAALLEKTLKSFNVDARVIKVSRGPSVTRFEVQPAPGVKVNRIVSLQDDIALNLEARSIRMEAPIPGKAAVGIEIENNDKKPVFLREIIESREFQNSESKITFAVGRDVSGNPVTANLKEMPHLLIAGSTGSGKSVCINSIILSLLYKAKPDEVKIIMVDPKVVELSNYNGIPHLLIPVVNDASKAAVALNWAVKEMEDRYTRFSEYGVKDLEGFNRKAAKNEDLEPMPQIVIIIDELADLMMAAPQQVEDAICRLAQMARAAGMHLIVATQRPSVDVITGVIKSNIPSRIAFAVSSQIDSRTILDGAGAEKLVGKGDMLFSPLGGMGKPLRVQGNFVSEDEIAAVIDYVSNQDHKQEYSNDLMDTIEASKIDYNEEGVDELLRDAIELVVKEEQASVSRLQRKFRIGYNRAGRLVDMMEERGIVGPPDGSRPRRVLLSKAGLEELDNRAVSEADLKNDDADSDDEDNFDGETRYVSDEYNSDSQAPEYEPDPDPEVI
ncbi:MAG: DNA translocase FtsK [Bacillota bacterium]|nr:DNA translocase FtsK [Bacillota bacterium]